MPRARRPLSRRQPLPQPGGDGTPRVRARRVQILLLSASRTDRGDAALALCAASRCGQSLERSDGHRYPLSRNPRRVPETLPCRRPDPADAAIAAIRRRRLQLPASGPLRRACVPTAGRDSAVGTGPRFFRRRIRADRAAATHAVAARSGAAGPGRRGGLCCAPPARAGAARFLPVKSAPWRQPAPLRPPPYPWRDLSRCEVSASLLTADLFENASDVRPSRELMAEGAWLLRGLAKPFETDLLAALRAIIEQAPFRHMQT